MRRRITISVDVSSADDDMIKRNGARIVLTPPQIRYLLRGMIPPREWQPLQRGHILPESLATTAAVFGEAASCPAEIWLNDEYTVTVVRAGEAPERTAHLSIRRNDRAPARDWRDFQRIKNELLGPEWEAIEIYPAESRLVDGANQFHLWGFEAGVPCGYPTRDVVDQQDDTLWAQREFNQPPQPAPAPG